jgi:hypothetical protein
MSGAGDGSAAAADTGSPSFTTSLSSILGPGGDRQIFTDSHAKSILTTMNALRKAHTLCDVVLKVEEQEFPAHRIVLAACSDYFHAMFTHGVSLITMKWD